jgi:hypothetical protein
MTRPKGVPNRRTQAALNAAQEKGFAEKADRLIARFLKVAEDTSLDLPTRLQALNSVLPYVKPKLSAVEQTTIEAPKDESQIWNELRLAIEADPAMRSQLQALLDGRPVEIRAGKSDRAA